jgi:hypothetical protein
MSGKPSRVKQREIQQVVTGAMRAGATKVVVQLGEASIVIHGNTSAAISAEPESNNSFDKIMRKPELA